MTIKRLRDWVMNKEWAVVLAVAVGAITALEGQLGDVGEGDGRVREAGGCYKNMFSMLQCLNSMFCMK